MFGSVYHMTLNYFESLLFLRQIAKILPYIHDGVMTDNSNTMYY